VVLVVFSLVFLRIVTLNQKTPEQNLLVEDQEKGRNFPVRLIIPAIGVNAGVQLLGVTSKGTMEVPNNAVDVGWFNFGPRPGEKGSAVMAGHFDGKNGEPGVFANLDKLKIGDKIYVEDKGGKSAIFEVTGSRVYGPGFAEEVFSSNDGIYLNLVTCDGVWDGTKKSYSQRLVVFADMVR
jgi:LPXTG-site transpeptidase (sortase) family protein